MTELAAAFLAHAERVWEADILPALHDYIAIPNVSVHFDADWKANGHMDRAVTLIEQWCRARSIVGLHVEALELLGRTPLIFMEVPAFGDADPAAPAVLLYGHLDKQPEMSGWRDGLGPWTPVLEGDRLYGRGGADDGYSAFASLTAIEAVQVAGGSHRRCVVLIEASEESGSPDLPAYVEHLASRIGDVDLVICLDSGCLDWDRMWVTTSLRGLVGGVLTVEVLQEGVHSGDASGIVPSSFRIIRQLLDRVEDAATGRVLVPSMTGPIPPDRLAEARATAAEMPEPAASHYRWAGSTQPMTDDPAEQLLARTWRPTLSVIGADGFPPTERAGNVLRPSTSLKLSFRVPPGVSSSSALDEVTRVLEADPPSGAVVRFAAGEAADGWNAPSFSPWLAASLERASAAVFGNGARTFGEGGSIPFMGMLGVRFPAAQFVVTGVLGPSTNAHGPNEFLHVPTGKRLTAAMSQILVDHTRS